MKIIRVIERKKNERNKERKRKEESKKKVDRTLTSET